MDEVIYNSKTYNFSDTTKEELQNVVLKLDESLMSNYRRASNYASELLLLKKENEKLKNALNDACVELTKAYKKSGKSNSKWLKSENWALKFMKKDN